jgi:galacturan 1,4-alpha-galacturonidase
MRGRPFRLFAFATVASLVILRHAEALQYLRRAVCTPPMGGNVSVDDTPAIRAALSPCGKGGTILIPQGNTYHLRTTLHFNGCENCALQLDGTLAASDDLAYWQGKRAIIHMSGVRGARIFSSTGTGKIDGNGLAAWDRFNSDKSYRRPTLHYIDRGSSDIVISDLNIENPPNVFFSATGGSTRITYQRLTMTAASRKPGVAIKNTDGFNPGQVSNVKILDVWISNQDDCIAFKNGADTITVSNITCIGSHGLSIGSLGSGAGSQDAVKNIHISKAVMKKSTKAAGIKVWPSSSSHGSATVSNITWDGVSVSDCEYAVQIQSCYGEKGPVCKESPSRSTISGVVFKDFSGSTNSKYSPIVANLNCPAAGTCGIRFLNFNVKPGKGSQPKVLCGNVRGGQIPGVSCSSGASG